VRETDKLSDTVLNTSAGLATVLAFAAVLGSLASAFALAGVFSFAAVIAGLASPLAFTLVLAFASVFAFVGIGKIVDGGTCYTGNARSIRPHCDGSGQEASNCCSGDDGFGWFHDVTLF
jgi:hypothetical protein